MITCHSYPLACVYTCTYTRGGNFLPCMWAVHAHVSGKMLRMLKIGCLSKITVSQVCLKVFSGNFLHNSGEIHVVVVSFTHIHSGLQQIMIFQ